MASTGFHKGTGRYLTSLGWGDKTVQRGSEHTLSIGHPLLACEFTTYRLGAVIAHDEWGSPLFDLDEAEIKVGDRFFDLKRLRAIRDDHTGDWRRIVDLDGIKLQRSTFGQFHIVEGSAI